MMNKTTLVRSLQSEHSLTKQVAASAVNLILGNMQTALRAERSVTFHGLGTLKVVHRKARMVRNPRTGNCYFAPRKAAAKFHASPIFKQRLQLESQNICTKK